jgi:hypothetical protein
MLKLNAWNNCGIFFPSTLFSKGKPMDILSNKKIILRGKRYEIFLP